MNDRIRVSDADRERVAARLREHYAEGRLSAEEMDERISAALTAKTAGDLRRVLADLPEPEPEPASVSPQAGPDWAGPSWAGPSWAGPRWSGPAWAGPRSVVYRRRPRLLPLALFALIVALVLPGAGWLFLAVFKLVLLFWLVAAVVGIVAVARFRHRARRYWQSGSGAAHWRHFQDQADW
jgi:Domain of unknown function (DUF1707)